MFKNIAIHKPEWPHSTIICCNSIKGMRMDKVNQLLALFGMELIAAPKQRSND